MMPFMYFKDMVNFIHQKIGDACDVNMGAMAYLITSLPTVYSAVYSGTDERKPQSSASLAFVRGIHRRSMNFLHKGPVTREKFLFDYVITVYPYRELIVYVLNSKKMVNR